MFYNVCSENEFQIPLAFCLSNRYPWYLWSFNLFWKCITASSAKEEADWTRDETFFPPSHSSMVAKTMSRNTHIIIFWIVYIYIYIYKNLKLSKLLKICRIFSILYLYIPLLPLSRFHPIPHHAICYDPHFH